MGCKKNNNRPYVRSEQYLDKEADLSSWLPQVSCVKVEKVFDSCQWTEMNEPVLDVSEIAVGQIDPESIECLSAELFIDDDHPFICNKIPGTPRVRVSFFYIFRVRFQDEQALRTVTSEPQLFDRTFTLGDVIMDQRAFAQCEVYLECDDAFLLNDDIIQVCIGKWVIVKAVSLVQLKVLHFGYCDAPDDCIEVEPEICPDFDPEWPPYIPQNNE